MELQHAVSLPAGGLDVVGLSLEQEAGEHQTSVLKLHSRYGPLDRSTAQGGRPLSRGFGPASYPATPLVSFQINRQLSGWNLPP